MASFKENLVQTVIDARQRIKNAVIKTLEMSLRTEMMAVAKRGQTSGSISVYSECDITQLNELEKVLELEGIDETSFEWIFQQIENLDSFDDIIFGEYDGEDKICFSWHMDDE